MVVIIYFSKSYQITLDYLVFKIFYFNKKAPEWEQDKFPASTPSRTSTSWGLGPHRSPVCKRDRGRAWHVVFELLKKYFNFGLGGTENWVILDLGEIG